VVLGRAAGAARQESLSDDPATYFEFIYPPLSRCCSQSRAGSARSRSICACRSSTSVAWWMTAQFSHAMAGSGRKPGPWLEALPGFVTVTSCSTCSTSASESRAAGADALRLLAAARTPWLDGRQHVCAGYRHQGCFPVAVLPYLVWRRQWAAAASMLGVHRRVSVRAAAPFRGFQHNFTELKTWYQGMVGSSSEKGFGQPRRAELVVVNQSIIAVTHRLTRPVNYNQDDPSKPVRTMNVAKPRFQDGELDRAGDLASDRLGYVAVMPPAPRRTELSDAEELGILFCLMTAATPLARQYYFLWLFFPITVRPIAPPMIRVRRSGPAHGCCSPRRAVCCASRFRCFRPTCRRMAIISPPHPADGRAGLAHIASACRRRCLASGHGRATT